MYPKAEPNTLLFTGLQRGEVLLSCVPPTAVTLGELAGKSTAGPCVAEATTCVGVVGKSQSAAPLSPEGPITVMPVAFACCARLSKVVISERGKSTSSQPP